MNQPSVQSATLQHRMTDNTIPAYDAKIMIVDDDSVMIELVTAYLEEEGYQHFISTDDARQAIDLLSKENPDLLMLDLNMPHVHGFDILSALREHEQFQYLPVIILTSATEANHKLRALSLGATDFLAKPVDPSELKLRIRNNLSAKAYQDQLAYYDKLTGLPNKDLFIDRLEWSLTRCQREQNQLAVVSIYLNQVAKVSDTLGSQAADEALQKAAKRLKRALRDSDAVAHGNTSNNQELSRPGGDEFSIIVQDIHDESELVGIAQRITSLFEDPLIVARQEVYLGIYIGIAVSHQDASTADDLLSKAEQAAREAAKQRISPCHFYSADSVHKAKKRLQMESELRRAIERDQLELFYQPKFNAKSLQLSGAEALIRWHHPEQGFISPAEFIPLAEECNLMESIGSWVMKTACLHNAEWNTQGFNKHKISVNVSAQQIEQADIVKTIADTLDLTQMQPSNLIIELTESMAMDDSGRHLQTLEQIKSLGVAMSIDDFGTGYSSLSYLNKLPVEELKIDKSFVDDIEGNAAILKAIVALGHSLDYAIVAEGVEDKSQMNFLRSISCDLLQGYLFSKPLAHHDYQNFLYSLIKKTSKAS